MWYWIRRAIAVWSLVSSLFCTAGYANDAAPPRLPPAGELADIARAAKEVFRPLTDADLQLARGKLAEAVTRLDRRLTADGPNGKQWREYLRVDRLQQELASGRRLEPAAMEPIQQRFAAEQAGLDMVWFADVRESLQQYLDTAENIGNPKLQPAYEQLLDFLAERLEAYVAKPTGDDALLIGQAIGQLENVRQAPELVAAIRRHFAQPNLLVEASSGLIQNAVNQPVDEATPVRDVILGTSIYGTGHTKGTTTAALVPNADRAVIELTMQGTTESSNVGYNGPVRVYNNTTTEIDSHKQVSIDATGLAVMPAVSEAETDSTITSICAVRGGQLVARIASKRAGKQKAEAESIGSLHAEQRANRRFDDEADALIDRANATFLDKLRRPLVEHGLFPQQLSFRTTADALHTVALQANAAQLAAPGAPPALPGPCDLAIRAHESLIGNLAAGALAGRTLKEEDLRQLAAAYLDKVPASLAAETDQEPWAVAFDPQQPISVVFAEDQCRLTIRGRKYYQGDTAHPAMNVTAVYKIVRQPEGFKAIRQGELQVDPPGFDGTQRLSTAQVVIRRLLQRRLGKVLQEEIVLNGFVPAGRLSKLGKIDPTDVLSRDGWLTVTCRQASTK